MPVSQPAAFNCSMRRFQNVASWPGGFVSAVYTDDDVVRTVAAFESTFDQLAAEGAL